ncbi:hypothetical protein FXB39_13860 [Nocardioides sp. BGMRC 2183]|nr:hypothetical protein FXB39_13860 [Nocardioides sp. BGMRC 2183]
MRALRCGFRRPHSLAAVLLATALLLTACTAAGTDGPGPDLPEGEAVTGCGPIRFRDVAGRAPHYLDPPLADSPNDHALCAGAWIPPTSGPAFVPQGLVVRDGTAWISGYDEGQLGSLFCRVLRVELRTGRLLDEQGPIPGRVGERREVECRHGGGLALDEHGLWLAEKRRLWLLEPQTLDTLRVWDNVLPVWGSALVQDGDGRLGQIGFGRRGPSQVHWFSPDDLLTPGLLDLTEETAVGRQFAPPLTQGAFWAELGGRERVWFIRSNTRCGILQGRRDRRYGFLPGAEGASVDGRRLWVVSESTSAPYFRQGGRPVVPQVARYDLRGIGEWSAPDCTL